VIRRVTLEAEKTGKTFYEALKADQAAFTRITAQLKKLGFDAAEEFFMRPENYRGLAAKKARALAQKYAALME
jgi:adenylosuccinate lyase